MFALPTTPVLGDRVALSVSVCLGRSGIAAATLTVLPVLKIPI